MSTDLVRAAEEALAKALREVMVGRSVNSTPGAAMLVSATAYALAIARGESATAPSMTTVKTELHRHGIFG